MAVADVYTKQDENVSERLLVQHSIIDGLAMTRTGPQVK